MNERSEVATVPFTGWKMDAVTMITHVRSELALHRWDLAGDDELSFELLSQPEFAAHAVRSLNAFAGLQESPAQRARASGLSSDFAVRLCTIDQPDVIATVQDGIGRLELADPVDGPALLMDAAARVLMLWGRRQTQAHDVRSTLDSGDLALLHRWMYGFERCECGYDAQLVRRLAKDIDRTFENLVRAHQDGLYSNSPTGRRPRTRRRSQSGHIHPRIQSAE